MFLPLQATTTMNLLTHVLKSWWTIFRHAISEELASLGARIHTCARDESQLNQCLQEWKMKGFNVTGSVCNISSRADREKLMEAVSSLFYGTLNILVMSSLTFSPSTHGLEFYTEYMCLDKQCRNMCDKANNWIHSRRFLVSNLNKLSLHTICASMLIHCSKPLDPGASFSFPLLLELYLVA